jgi:hypothetical protein
MSSVDYTPVLLAQLTDLQMRVTKQDAVITALKAEVERLSGHPLPDTPTMRTSVPLRSNAPEYNPRGEFRDRRGPRQTDTRPPRQTDGRPPRRDGAAGGGDERRSRPKVAPSGDKSSTGPHPTMTLADVLEKDEEVTMEVRTGKDKEGNDTQAVVVATFDGTDLVVTECELAESLVDMKSSKPGVILYKFIDELKNAGHIKRTFTIAPWRLCFVERDGVRKSLEELRSTVG